MFREFVTLIVFYRIRLMEKNIYNINHLEVLEDVVTDWVHTRRQQYNFVKRNSYFIGGTLCVDFPELNDVFCYNLNECVSSFRADKKRLLGIEEVKIVFEIFEKVLGKNEYFKESFNKSFLRHLV